MDVENDLPRNVAGGRLSVSQLENTCYRLGIALKAGVPVAQAWNNESELLRGKARTAFCNVLSELQDGAALADAMSRDKTFPAMMVEMVRVGEETGELDQAFLKLADHYRNFVSMKRTFWQGVTWPALQTIAAVTVISLFLVALSVLETKVSGLRAPDIFMLGFSPLGNLVLLWAMLSLGAVSLFLIVQGVRFGWFGSLPLRIAMAVPLLGNTIKTLALSRFAWSFGMAVDAGMNAQRAVRLGLRSTQNLFYRIHESAIAESVSRGKAFFTALRQTNAFPNDLLQAVQVGESTGHLTESLERLSDDYRERAAISLRRISQISGFSIFMMVSSVIGFSIMLMYASYLSTMAEAMSANSLTLEEIREGQETSNPILATRNELVKDFTENNEDFKQIESIYTHLGKYNEMTPNEFLDGLFPDPKRPDRRPEKERPEQADQDEAHRRRNQPQ